MEFKEITKQSNLSGRDLAGTDCWIIAFAFMAGLSYEDAALRLLGCGEFDLQPSEEAMLSPRFIFRSLRREGIERLRGCSSWESLPDTCFVVFRYGPEKLHHVIARRDRANYDFLDYSEIDPESILIREVLIFNPQ